MNASILVVDDEPTVQEALETFLRAEGHAVVTAGSGKEALSRIEEGGFDLIVADLVMPGMSGLEVLERSRAFAPSLGVILITGHATVETAIEALRKGAFDYLQKPFQLDDLASCVERLLRHRELARGARLRPEEPAVSGVGEALVGQSRAMQALRAQIARCGPTPSNVLISGESGTGKELVARAIHAASARRSGPFVPVNCGAIPDSLLESQLFGHVRGAFTNAVQANPGLFVAAHGGTLYLDEVAEMPCALQVKLLRVIEERQVWAVGATRPLAVDVRIVASTNRDLAREVQAERFRTDFFYRLEVVHLRLPPLRERRDDIPLLADHLVRRLNAKLNRAVRAVEPDALALLVNHGWNGNVRELENVLERAMILGDGECVRRGDLSWELASEDSSHPAPTDLREAVRQFESQHIRDVLAQTRSDKREAARLLGISLASLYRKLNVEPENGSAPEE
jgi:DNA-binding NtrC family response regulator